jgi:hypothetical protein
MFDLFNYKLIGMRSARKVSGKQQTKTAKLGTENRRTHDVKPATLNPEQGTQLLAGPIFLILSPAAGFRSPVLGRWTFHIFGFICCF